MARVLVADNDPDALDLLLIDLGHEGHIVRGVPDGAAALATIGDFAPDVVVLDHRMPPGPDGLTVGIRLRAEHTSVRVIIYSNYRDSTLCLRAEQHGIRFLPKGNLRTLRAVVSGQTG